MNTLDELITLNKDVTFKCKPAGGAQGEYFAHTLSELAPPADKKTLELINTKLTEHAKEFIEFFAKHNSARFHVQPTSGASSLAVYAPEAWNDLKAEMLQWFEMMDEDELEETGIDWLNECVVFAEIPESGNYFVMALSGEKEGKIIYSDHDGLESEIYANSFNEFLIKFLSSPASQIYHLGCYTRYSDNKTDIQWIPGEVVKP